MALKLGVFGAAGRMGKAVVRTAQARGHQLVAAVGGQQRLGEDVGLLAGLNTLGVKLVGAPASDHRVDVWVDFAPAAGIEARAAHIARTGAAWVCASTGLSAAQLQLLDETSRHAPVLWEPNFSLGVHVLSALVKQAALQLGAAFHLEVVEAHHGAKRDAPSGTAKRLVEASGRADAPIHALRGGDVIGDHTVHFLGDGERLELTHRATDRDLFARGAMTAAAWLSGRAAARYTLADVLRPSVDSL